MSIAENIKKYRKAKGYTQNDLAKLLNVKPTTISAWEVGRNKPLMDKIEMLSNLLGVKKSDIIGEDKTKLPNNIVPVSGEIKRIPVIGTIACGTPILAEQNIESYEGLPASLLPSNTDNLFFLKCKGNSMSPTIKDGSLVLIRMQPDVENDEVAAVLIDGEATLKRIKKLNGEILLMPDNSNYSPIILNSHNNNKIIGKAIQTLNYL